MVGFCIALVFALGFGVASIAQSNEFTISGVYYFGCDGSYVDSIKAAMPIHVGDKFAGENQKVAKNKAWNAVWQVIRCSPTDVALITCENRTWNVYIGLPGRSVSTASSNPAPKEKLDLPKEAVSLYDDMMHTLAEVLAEKGGCGEDDSKGYSLAEDPNLRAKELEFRNWALQHQSIIRDVLKTSSDSTQRLIAASALGYMDPSKEQIGALVDASMDENSGVRNNATRALGCIAGFSKDMAAQIPPDSFIQLLNSGTWSDRNKAGFVVRKLYQQDPTLANKLRKTALQALAEMSCWDEPHAMGARFLLGKVSSLPADRLNQLCLAGDVEALVKAAKGKDGSDDSAPLAPSLPELGVILREVFVADQSDGGRTKASECYDKLLQLNSKFAGTKLAPDYLNALSFESFHMGQSEALDKKSSEAAIADFAKSLAHAEDCHKAWQARNEKYAAQSADEWTNYVRATIFYLKGDLREVDALKDKCGSNKATITRLLDGLKKYDSPDYTRDYLGKTAAE
jgi:tetratricopeptide (TPR) repeat protein